VQYVDTNNKDVSRFNMKNRDLLISAIGTIGKVALVDELYNDAIASKQLYILRSKNNTGSPRYLFHVLCSKPLQDSLQSRATGNYIRHLSKKQLASGLIPIPIKGDDEENIAGHVENYVERKSAKNCQNYLVMTMD
jgi:restriction endonuclease S subunit